VRIVVWAALSLLLILAGPARSEFGDVEPTDRVYVDDVHPAPDGKRVVEVYVRPVAKSRGPVEWLSKKSVQPTQDGKPIDRFDLELLADSGRGTASVLALDVSRTMRGESFDRAKAAALDYLDSLGDADRVAVVAFGGQAAVVAPFSASRSEARTSLEALEVDAGALQTALFDGVLQALDLLRDEKDLPRRQYVVVFSDAAGSGGTQTLEAVADRAKGGEGEPRIPVYAIGHARYDPADLDTLRKLARETGADFFEAGDLGQIPGHLKTIASQNARSYVVAYPASLDGRRHEIEVRVEGKSDRRAAVFPEVSGLSWWWFGGGAAIVLLVAGLAFLLLGRRSAGRLVFLAGARVGEVVPLHPGALQIGAIDDNDVVIPSGRVSRYHARVLVDGRRVEIEDLGSTNGTEVNDEPIQRCRLRPGDRIVLAKEVELEYQR
jgi:VWFA-related protein